MYGSALTYTRIRNGYDDDRIGTSKHSPGYPWHSQKSIRPIARSTADTNAMTSGGNTSGSQTTTPTRRSRYSRASTTSVTQLLSDSCTSLLQKLTTRVRGPSATFERSVNNNYLNNANNVVADNAASNNVSTRSRLEDKYAAMLDKIYGKKRTQERTLPPLTKSATTSNVLLSEKAYPYVSLTNSQREKTPYRSDSSKNYQKKYPEPPYTYLDRDSVYRVRQRSSNHSELRPRRSTKPQRSGKSEHAERRPSNSLKLFPIDISIDNEKPYKKPTSPLTSSASLFDDEKTPTNVDPLITEREAKRKEIQSLIMKYSALDEAYNRTGLNINSNNSNSNNNNNNSTNSANLLSNASSSSSTKSSLAVIPNVATSSSKAHLYNTRLTSAVSKRPFE